MIEHTTRAFDTELRELARKIAEMGRLDGEQITAALGALVKRGIALAKRVIATDDQVDALQRAIEEKAVATIARRQPMAVDLREIIGALRIERVGDLAQNIAKRVLLLTDEFRIHEVVAGYANESRDVQIPPIGLAGILQIPKNAYALVAFAHGSGSSRLSPRNTIVARALNDRGIATLLFDLLTSAEEADRANVFNIPLLADRLVDAVHWIDGQASVAKLPLGLFGASTGAAAALVAAANFLAASAQWSRAAGALTSLAMRSTRCRHQLF